MNGEEEGTKVLTINYIWSLSWALSLIPNSPKLLILSWGSNQCIQAWTVTLMDVLPYAWQYQEEEQSISRNNIKYFWHSARKGLELQMLTIINRKRSEVLS